MDKIFIFSGFLRIFRHTNINKIVNIKCVIAFYSKFVKNGRSSVRWAKFGKIRYRYLPDLPPGRRAWTRTARPRPAPESAL